MIKVIHNGIPKRQELGLPFSLASVARITGKLNGQEVDTACSRLIFYRQEEQNYLAIVRRGQGRGKPNKVAKIFTLTENNFEFIRNGRSLFYTLSLSIGSLQIYPLNSRLDLSHGVETKFETMIQEFIESENKQKQDTPRVIRRRPKDGGEL